MKTNPTPKPKKGHPWRGYGNVPTPAQREAERLKHERIVAYHARMGIR